MTYDEITLSLTEEQHVLGAAEMHGFVCGMLCANAGMPENESPTLSMLYQETQRQLQQDFTDDAFMFTLLLPGDDSDAINQRAHALSEWCQGFLSGLGQAGLSESALKSDDVAELLQDIESISKVDVENNQDTLEDELSYVELVEYVRMAVLNLYTDFVLTGQAT